jgi:flagellar biogenesis protein FliO
VTLARRRHEPHPIPPTKMKRPIIRRIAVATCLGAFAASAPSFALEPAGGSPEPALAAPEGAGEPDASVEEAPAPPADPGSASGARSWLARGGGGPAIEPAKESSGASTGLTLGAVVVVLGLAGAAIFMRFKRQTALPMTPSESRLTVLSSSRVGPKAYAVTAHVGGRVLLLGVTDHSVANLGWLDAREPEAPGAMAEPDTSAGEQEPEGDELPDDYPGSALRASRAPVNFATSSELKRFQEVLRGAVSSRAELPIRPSYAPSRAPDAAMTLAAQTMDVVSSSAAAPTGVPTSVSLRRKRRGRESIAPREVRASAPSRAPKAIDPALEGQVLGLRTLRNGS